MSERVGSAGEAGVEELATGRETPREGSWSISVEAGADSEELCGGDFGYSLFLKQTRFGERMPQLGVTASVKTEGVKHPV